MGLAILDLILILIIIGKNKGELCCYFWGYVQGWVWGVTQIYVSMWVAAEPTAMSYSGECILLVRFKAVGSLGCHPLLIFIVAQF